MIKPTCIASAALSLLFAAAGSARADTTYLLTLQGTDQRYYPVCRLVDQPPPCDTTVDLGWTGTLDVVVDSGADGVYSDTDVRRFDFQTNAGSLALPSLPGGSVTVAGGRITSVSLGSFPGDDGDYSFDGLHAYYSRDFDAPHTGSDLASGQLTAVPEPAGTTLMGLALACAWAAARGRRAASGPVRPRSDG